MFRSLVANTRKRHLSSKNTGRHQTLNMPGDCSHESLATRFQFKQDTPRAFYLWQLHENGPKGSKKIIKLTQTELGRIMEMPET
jgi:hypothetical protein